MSSRGCLLLSLSVSLVSGGCASDGGERGGGEGDACAGADGESGSAALAEFSLADRNETSPTSAEHLTPRCYLGQISAWYMLDAT